MALSRHRTHLVRIPGTGRFAKLGDQWRARCGDDERMNDVEVMPGDEGKHDIPGQAITGCCWYCSEVECDDDCKARSTRQAGDAIIVRSVIVNRATGAVTFLERGTSNPLEVPFATLDLVVQDRPASTRT